MDEEKSIPLTNEEITETKDLIAVGPSEDNLKRSEKHSEADEDGQSSVMKKSKRRHKPTPLYEIF